MTTISIDTQVKLPPTRDVPASHRLPSSLKPANTTHVHPTISPKNNNAKLYFVGTATTILEWEGLRLMTDPNFLHAGDHVHLGPGVTGTRQTNPAVDLHELPNIDVILLSHYHADHFDEEVEASLRRDLPIVTTPHAKDHLTTKEPPSESFTSIYALDFWDHLNISVKQQARSSVIPENRSSVPLPSGLPTVKVTGMPGKHVPDTGVISTLNDLLGAVPPTNGWMLELGYSSSSSPSATTASVPDFNTGYRIYISGDTLLVSDLHKIPELYTHAGKHIDLMLIHLGGTTIPSPKLPLLMVTMDAKQGVELVKLIDPGLTVPIHYDDYDVFLSPLSDFKDEMIKAGLQDKVVYLDRGDQFEFEVRKGRA